jgi:hypothetical protein
MLRSSDSLIINDNVRNDSINSQTSQVKDVITQYKNNSYENEKNFSSDSIKKPNEIISLDANQLHLIAKKDSDSSNNFLKTYSFEPWSKIISVNNKVYESLNEKREIYKNDNNSKISTAENKFKGNHHFYENNLAISNIILLLILYAFVLLAWAKISFGKYLVQLLRALINYSDAAKLYIDQNIIIDRLYFLLNSIFTIAGGLFIYYFIERFNKEILLSGPFIILTICLGIIISIYVYRYIFSKIFGFILNQIQVFNEYLHSMFMYYKAMGLFLLPLIFFIYVLSENYRVAILIIGAIIIFILYVISIFRVTRIMMQKGILLFYWILYLCTVEFLPIILLYKFVYSKV